MSILVSRETYSFYNINSSFFPCLFPKKPLKLGVFYTNRQKHIGHIFKQKDCLLYTYPPSYPQFECQP